MAINYTMTGRSDEPTPTVANAMSAGYGTVAGQMSPSFNNMPTPTFGGGTAGQRYADLQDSLGSIGYQRSGVQRERAMSLDDLARGFSDMRRRIPGAYNKRGMLDSGQFQRGLGRSYEDELRRAGRTEMGMQGALERLALQQLGAERQFARAGLQDALSDAARRAQLATQIRGAY